MIKKTNLCDIENLLLPEKVVFQNEMILDVAGFNALFDMFKNCYLQDKASFSWKKTYFDENSYMYKDLKKALVRTFGEKEFFIQLGVNTESISLYHGVNALMLQEAEDGLTADHLKDLPLDPLQKVRVPIAPLLKMLLEVKHEDYQSIDFEGVTIIKIRDYENQEEISLSIDEVKNGSSE